jgi:hypothetical protein
VFFQIGFGFAAGGAGWFLVEGDFLGHEESRL